MYFITCFQKVGKDKNGWIEMGAARTFGYFESFEDANESLKVNSCDMWETIYHYAVVENIEQGIHPIVKERWFYKYDREKDGYFPINEPIEFKHFCNFALG